MIRPPGTLRLIKNCPHVLLLLIVALLVAGCGLDRGAPSTVTAVSPTDTPQARLEPQSTRAATTEGSAADRENITALVATMQADVVAGNKEAYLSHVDLSDPIFALEHSRWADGWVKNRPATFALQVRAVVSTASSATASLTMRWKMAAPDAEERTATLPVRFTRSADSSWRYAGELWVPFQSEHFVVKVMPGLEEVASALTPELPEVYSHVTASLGYTPSRNPEIKLYDTSETLVAMTLLHLPNIGGWNEPGEALKFRAASYEPALKGGIAHEFTHYLTFDRSGTAHTRMPWWLDEGLAVYVGSRFVPADRAEERMGQVREWADEGGLADWDSISDFESTPVELWEYTYPQGYAMVRYITERFGDEQRNRWVAAMATDMEIKQATAEVLGLPFEELDRAFVAWAKQQ